MIRLSDEVCHGLAQRRRCALIAVELRTDATGRCGTVIAIHQVMSFQRMIVAVGFVATLGAPSGAAASSPCHDDNCRAVSFFPARGTVPANLPAIRYQPAYSVGDYAPDGGYGLEALGSDVRFVRLDASGAVDVEFHVRESTSELFAGEGDLVSQLGLTDPSSVRLG